jgi:hypothetical protein
MRHTLRGGLAIFSTAAKRSPVLPAIRVIGIGSSVSREQAGTHAASLAARPDLHDPQQASTK